MDLIGRLHRESFLFVSREEFERGLEGADVEPVEHDGRVIGAFVVRGPSLHFAKFDATPVGRVHLQRLQQLIAQHGYAETKTPKDDVRQRRFNERLGFIVTGEDDFDYHMKITHLRGKETLCP